MQRMLVRTSDGVDFKVASYLVHHMETLKNLQSEQSASASPAGAVILPRTSSLTFWKVLEWCQHHSESEDGNSEECQQIRVDIDVNELSQWDLIYLQIRFKSLVRLMEASVDLGIPCLLSKAYSVLNRWERDSLPDMLKMYFDLDALQ